MQGRIARGTSLMAVAVFMVVYLAQAQNQGGIPAEFKPTIGKKVDARSSPAKATGEEESALTSKGYVRIGTISASQPGRNADPDITQQLQSAILQKAAEAGGDVVRFSKEGAFEVSEVPTGKTKTERTCEQSQTVTATEREDCGRSCITDSYGNTDCTNNPCTPRTNTFYRCVKWGEPIIVPITRKEKGLVSEGAVWRYDPKLAADIAHAAEAAREVNRKAVAAEMDYKTLHERLSNQQDAEAELLLAQGANVNACGENGWTHLHDAAFTGGDRKQEVELLLAHGADVKAKDKYGETPLHKAAWGSNTKVAELLLAHGADVNARDDTGGTPLLDANSKEVAELLLAHGADVNARSDLGATPLHHAASVGNKEVVEVLLAHGADVNAIEHYHGQTPLHMAADKGNRDIAELLLAHGADVNARNNGKQTPMGLAAQNKLKDMVQLLRQHGGHK